MKMICGKDDLNLPDVKIYDPYKPGTSPVAMNLQVLDLAAWIEVDRRLPLELAEKRRLLAERKADVFAALPEADLGSQETLDLLIQHLLAHYPQVYQKQDQVLFNRATGERWSVSQSDLHPLELAGRLVQEDLCLMTSDQDQDVYRLTAACLCFPTRWRLLEKLG